MDATVLIVDDQPENLDLLRNALEPMGFEVLLTSDGESALKAAVRARPDVVLLDVRMPPGIDGFETCRRLKAEARSREIPVIFITASGDTEDIVRGFEVGGVDYILKPFRPAEVRARLETHLQVARLTRSLAQKNTELTAANDKLRAEIERREQAETSLHEADERFALLTEQEASRWGLTGFVAAGPAMAQVIEDIRKLQPISTSVLITGESGTGKELVARALHFGGPRARGPFVPMNCAAIPHDVAESELFGHVRGAFTGATGDRAGAFQMADGGTLFLDEIGEMSLSLQAKLLRALEDGVVRPVGGSKERTVNTRVVAATNADLSRRIADGQFRQDLFYRLARFPIEVPPLRDRPEDIPQLVLHFARLVSAEMGRPTPAVSASAVALLVRHPFPGNVRELKNLVERALIESRGAEIRPEHVKLVTIPSTPPPGTIPGRPPEPSVSGVPLNLADAEMALIREALKKADGNVSEAARLLGVDRGKIYRRLAREGEASPS